MVGESRTSPTVEQDNTLSKLTWIRPTTEVARNHGFSNAFAKKEYGVAPLKISFKRTNSEFSDRRGKGLCFLCEGKFAPSHRCLHKTLQVLLVDEENVDPQNDEHVHFPP